MVIFKNYIKPAKKISSISIKKFKIQDKMFLFLAYSVVNNVYLIW